MKILHISSADTLGGGERHLADLANGLAARGHQVYAAVRSKSPLIRELVALEQENILCSPLRNALDAPSARRLAQFVRKHQIHIVHAHMARDYPLAAYAARANTAARLIVTRHVLFPLGRIHSIALSNVSRVIAVSHAVASALRDQSLFPAARVVVIPNGIVVQRFEAVRAQFDRREFCRRWQLNENSLLVGTVGELKALKGHKEFLRAAAIIARHFPHTEFLVAGIDPSQKRDYEAKLRSMIAELGLTKRVHLLGWLDDLAPFHCALDVFVSASRSESFGLAITEAMASGTPVVATKTEGAKEVIRDGETGILVAIEDIQALASAVIEVLADQDKSRRIATRASAAAREQFSLARMVDQTEAIYRAAFEPT